MAAGKKNDVLAHSNANATSASELDDYSRARSEFLNTLDTPQNHVSKRKAEEISSSRCSSDPPANAMRPGICSVTDRNPMLHGRTRCPEQPATRFDRGCA